MTMDQRVEFLFQSIESHDRQLGEITGQIGEITDQIGELKEAIEKLVAISNEDATAIRTLARIAEVHERRISEIEENR